MIRNEICTERLTLRPFNEGDAPAVADYWNSDPNWSRFNESVPLDHTIRDAQKFVAEMISRDREDQPSWAVLLEERVVGVVSLTFEQDHRISVIGYGIHGGLKGRDISAEASIAVLKYAFDCYPQLQKVRAHTDAKNTASIRVLEKLGFSQEGILRSNQYAKGEFIDETIYGLLRDEWLTSSHDNNS